MKKNLSDLNFEILFALGIITILLLPPLVMAKVPKEHKVTIRKSTITISIKSTTGYLPQKTKKPVISKYKFKIDTGTGP